MASFRVSLLILVLAILSQHAVSTNPEYQELPERLQRELEERLSIPLSGFNNPVGMTSPRFYIGQPSRAELLSHEPEQSQRELQELISISVSGFNNTLGMTSPRFYIAPPAAEILPHEPDDDALSSGPEQSQRELQDRLSISVSGFNNTINMTSPRFYIAPPAAEILSHAGPEPSQRELQERLSISVSGFNNTFEMASPRFYIGLPPTEILSDEPDSSSSSGYRELPEQSQREWQELLRTYVGGFDVTLEMTSPRFYIAPLAAEIMSHAGPEQSQRELLELLSISVSGFNTTLEMTSPRFYIGLPAAEILSDEPDSSSTTSPPFCIATPASDLLPEIERLLSEYRCESSPSQAPPFATTASEIPNLSQRLDTLSEMIVGMKESQDDTASQLLTIERALERSTAILNHLLEVATKEVTEPPAHLGYKDCTDALAKGQNASGVYEIQPRDDGESFKVFCDMETDGGGWTVFQRRLDGSVNFFRVFDEYSRGFGDVEGEFWLGNEYVHRMTAQEDYELRIDLTDFADEYVHAVYDTFKLADACDKYRLTVEGYSGTAGDSFSYHSTRQFSTKDQNNDACCCTDCPNMLRGAWWYCNCYRSNLNAQYLEGDSPLYRGIGWTLWRGRSYSLKSTEMKIRAKN